MHCLTTLNKIGTIDQFSKPLTGQGIAGRSHRPQGGVGAQFHSEARGRVHLTHNINKHTQYDNYKATTMEPSEQEQSV